MQMIEEKKLTDPVFIIDRNDPDQEECLVTAKNKMEERKRHSRNFLFLFGFIGSALVLISLTFLHLRRSSIGDDFVKFRTSIMGSGGNSIEQEVISSEKNNTIEYYIAASPNERLTIVDDFNKNVQVVRISTGSGNFCYVTELKQSAYAPPSQLDFVSQRGKQFVSQVFETFEKQADERQLGERGAELCRGLTVEWIRPVADTVSQTSAANFTESSYDSQSLSRSKRGIRHCHISCCYSVCCCSVHRFTWERAEHFTCNHICNRCTKRSKTVIRKVC